MFKVKSLLRIWQLNFCDGDYARCARYQLSEQGKPVPLTLLPNGELLRGPVKATT